jgi:hypothetical protein
VTSFRSMYPRFVPPSSKYRPARRSLQVIAVLLRYGFIAVVSRARFRMEPSYTSRNRCGRTHGKITALRVIVDRVSLELMLSATRHLLTPSDHKSRYEVSLTVTTCTMSSDIVQSL